MKRIVFSVFTGLILILPSLSFAQWSDQQNAQLPKAEDSLMPSLNATVPDAVPAVITNAVIPSEAPVSVDVVKPESVKAEAVKPADDVKAQAVEEKKTALPVAEPKPIVKKEKAKKVEAKKSYFEEEKPRVQEKAHETYSAPKGGLPHP